MKYIDKLLNRITMYRLVVYVLCGYVGLATIFAFMGKLAFTPTNIVVSLAAILLPAYLVNKFFGRLFAVPTNSESWLITALILFLIIQPADSLATGIALVLAGAASSASKFVVTWNNRHIFNPAALAAALVSLTALQPTTWWIGSSLFWPFTLVMGLAVTRKIRRLSLLASFVGASVLVQLGLFLLHHQNVALGMKGALLASPLIFLGTVMLTEPATMPPRRRQQVIFGVLVGVLYVTAWGVGSIYIYPEVALLLGNVYAFVVSPKLRACLRLTDIQRISDKVYNYVFGPDKRFSYLPGQYMEWTLDNVPYDSRGNRRTFTLASSPTEPTVQLGVKYYEPVSAYKSVLGRMKLGDVIYASQLAGNFTLGSNASEKLAFVAGGIGITPFRSMVKHCLDVGEHRDIVLIYAVSNATELAYVQDFMAAKAVGLRFVPVVTDLADTTPGVVHGPISSQLLQQVVPDLATRNFYISGSTSMVDATKSMIRKLGVSQGNIKTDHFSGY